MIFTTLKLICAPENDPGNIQLGVAHDVIAAIRSLASHAAIIVMLIEPLTELFDFANATKRHITIHRQ